MPARGSVLWSALELFNERSGSSGNGPQAILFPVAVRPPYFEVLVQVLI